jgi:hypothetical protein
MEGHPIDGGAARTGAAADEAAAAGGTWPGEDAARARLDALFETFDRLTPDELGRIGIGSWDEEARRDLLDAVAVAAERTGRAALVDEARTRARDAVLARYSSGTMKPTWAGLNWGLSQGTVEDRVAIVEVLSDAAAAAVLADVLEPDVYDALSLPAEHVVAMSGGMVAEGALGRQMAAPADPDLGRRQAVRRMVAVGAGLMVFITMLPLAFVFDLPAAPLMALLAAIVVVVAALRR